MRTEYLDYLVKVVEVCTLTGAASQLYISPQGMSHAMQQLEHDFSTTLFYKKNNRLVLTAYCEAKRPDLRSKTATFRF